MKEPKRFHRWNMQDSDLADLTPEKARDIIVRCFFEAQKEALHSENNEFNKKDYGQIHDKVVSIIWVAFTDVGGDFEKPTKEILIKVVNRLADMANSWDTPDDIIEHHKSQIARMLSMLE